jgi:hypothetical protein
MEAVGSFETLVIYTCRTSYEIKMIIIITVTTRMGRTCYESEFCLRRKHRETEKENPFPVQLLNICCTAVQEREGREGMENGEERLTFPLVSVRLSVCSLCNDAVSASDGRASSDYMIVNNELERMWKGAVVAYFRAPSRNRPGMIEGN